jgi:PhzF family phenazine biosynthesis protein
VAKQYRVCQVDAFTTEPFTGNPAGVVPNADGLTELQMQRIARELNNSETAFIFSPTAADHDVQVRFFTPTREVPICGHATIAAHYVLATTTKSSSRRVLQKTGAGILPVDIVRTESGYQIVMTQGRIELGSVLEEAARQTLLSALHLQEHDLEARCPIQIVSTGHSKVMIGIRSRATLNRLAPDLGALAALSQAIDCNGYFVFTLDSTDPAIRVHGRMFAPAIGISEDPVTGNANGPLGAYLVHHGLIAHDNRSLTFIAQQGEAIHRPGTMEVRVGIRDKQPVEVQIVGNAVVVFDTEILVCEARQE